MSRIALALVSTLFGAVLLAAADDTVVFRSDVSLIRVDVQVVDRNNRAITGLRAEDFVLRDEGKTQEIRNFAREDMPVDLLFLLDVSSSMRPHVERIADAAHEALAVLGDNDRFAIMVFDRSTRLRMPFRTGRSNVERELDSLLRQESFHGGTDITRGMYDAASYIRREGRRNARRAIVILTDDETEMNRDDAGVLRELERADTVMSALIAPDAMRTHGGPMGGPGQGGGGTWPNGGGGGPLGGIILGRRGGYGNRGPGGGGMGSRTHSAGTSEIARNSGGDSMPVDDASALETTLARLRQRYALHFYLPGGARPGQQRNISVQLASAVQQRYPDAEVRFRHTYLVPDGVPAPGTAPAVEVAGTDSDPVVVRASSATVASGAEAAGSAPGTLQRRRRAVNEDGSPVGGPVPDSAEAGSPAPEPAVFRPDSTSPAPLRGWRRVDESTSGSTAGPIQRDADASGSKDAEASKDAPKDAKDSADSKDSQSGTGGWRRVKPDPQ